METKALLLKIRQVRLYLLAAALIAGVAGTAYVYYVMEHGFAQIGIKLVTTPVIRTGDNVEIYGNIFNANQLVDKQRVMIFSDEMVAHLNRRLNLYAHYDIPPNGRYAFERLTKKMDAKVSLEKRTTDVLAITFHDADAEFAAALLDEMVVKLDAMYRTEINEMLRANAAVYADVQEQLLENVNAAQTSLLSRLRRVDSIIDAGGPASDKALFGAQLAVYKQTSDLHDLKNELARVNKNFLVTENTILKQNEPIVRVFSRPVPSYGRRLYVSLACGGVAAFCMVMVIVVGIFFRYEYAWELRTLFGSVPPDEGNSTGSA